MARYVATCRAGFSVRGGGAVCRAVVCSMEITWTSAGPCAHPSSTVPPAVTPVNGPLRVHHAVDVHPPAAAPLEPGDLVQHLRSGRRAEVCAELHDAPVVVRTARLGGQHLEPGPPDTRVRREVVGPGARVPGAEHVVVEAERVRRV